MLTRDVHAHAFITWCLFEPDRKRHVLQKVSRHSRKSLYSCSYPFSTSPPPPPSPNQHPSSVYVYIYLLTFPCSLCPPPSPPHLNLPHPRQTFSLSSQGVSLKAYHLYKFQAMVVEKEGHDYLQVGWRRYESTLYPAPRTLLLPSAHLHPHPQNIANEGCRLNLFWVFWLLSRRSS